MYQHRFSRVLFDLLMINITPKMWRLKARSKFFFWPPPKSMWKDLGLAPSDDLMFH